MNTPRERKFWTRQQYQDQYDYYYLQNKFFTPLFKKEIKQLVREYQQIFNTTLCFKGKYI